MTGSPVRVVLVDDYPPIRRLVGDVLERAGCVVAGEAGDGRIALDLLARVPCEVVLMDYRMPVMDGIEATRALLQHDDAPAVIGFTSDNDPRLVARFLEAGAVAHFVKEDVKGLVKYVLGRGWTATP